MPWLMGIDEAGYGPNLGPFVMSSTLFHVPEEWDHQLWKPLRSVVRKAKHKADGRLVVDDSKQVYSPKLGMGVLIKNLWPFLRLVCNPAPTTLNCLSTQLIGTPREDLEHEPFLRWGESCLGQEEGEARLALLRHVMASRGITLLRCQSQVVTPRRFNQIVRDTDSKAAVPLQSASALVRSLLNQCDIPGRIHIVVDRLGGRWHYAERIVEWFPGKPIQVLEETALVSRYRVGQEIEIAFIVEADAKSLPVALASMLSKFLRELFMAQFNGWFQGHQADVTPTAGYPVDSHRFWKDVEPTRTKLGLVESDWWRER